MSFTPYYPVGLASVDEWPGLSMSEIHAAFPKGTFSRNRPRSRRELLERVRGLPAAMTGPALQDALRAKQEARSAARVGLPVAREDVREGGVEGMLSSYRSFQVNLEKFLEVPTGEKVKECHRDFLRATSNDGLAREVCQSCERLLWKRDCELLEIEKVPNKHLLAPKHPHPAHELHNGMLLVPECLRFEEPLEEGGNRRAFGYFCDDCLKALKSTKLPALSLSNRMWVGRVPEVLRGLTVPEQMLISLNYPRFFIFKLSPKGAIIHDPTKKQRALKGTVTTFPLNCMDVAKMLEGELLPRRPTILAAVIGVSFIGMGQVPKDVMRGNFRVRRAWVGGALRWLCDNNKYYRGLKINEIALNSLPEDDVPEELITIMRHEPSADLAARESAGYMPEEEDEDVDDEEAPTGDDELLVRLAFHDHQELAGRDKRGGPDVIPMKVLGSTDSESGGVSNAELVRAALENALHAEEDGPYAVRHSWDAVSEFPPKVAVSRSESASWVNHVASCYPTLFPYGEGGLEDVRDVKVSYVDHARALLRRRGYGFCTHHSFPFLVFSVVQKRQLMSSAKLQMSQASFDANARLIDSLRPQDLKEAEDDEDNNRLNKNPRIRALRNQIHATSSRVMASNESRVAYRAEIWGTTLYLRPPSLWMTLNFSDLDDPIVQFLCGEEIDMDHFDRLAGPDPDERARNVANNPLAASEGFFVLMNAVLETLVGVRSGKSTTSTQGGVLGEVSAYFGVVEAQGRGTLHLHMMLWMHNAPNTDEMQTLLQSEAFRARMKNYIAETICADLPGVSNEDDLKRWKKEAHLPYSRPPNPDGTGYEAEIKRMGNDLARAQQVHTCKISTCLKFDRNHNLKCKRRAPFPLADDDFVNEDGTWGVKRRYGYLNSWIPKMICQIRANHDLKLTTNGSETRGGTFYVTKYATKGQDRSYNKSAILAKAFLYHLEKQKHELARSLKEKNRLLLFRAINLQNRQQELSAPQAMSYNMGFGDVFRSHRYARIYTGVLRRHLLMAFPAVFGNRVEEQSDAVLQANRDSGIEVPVGNEDRFTRAPWTGDSNVGNVNLEIGVGEKISSRSQVDDYRFRGAELEAVGYLSFFVDTYEDAVLGGRTDKSQDAPTIDDETPKVGRRRNDCVEYLNPHPLRGARFRVIRSLNHNTLPSIVGPFFPRPGGEGNDYSEEFCLTVLALLKPWRKVEDLCENFLSWKQAFDDFIASACRRDIDVVAGIKYYYQCSDAATALAKKKQEEVGDTGDAGRLEGQKSRGTKADPLARTGEDEMEVDESEVVFTEEILEDLIRSSVNEREDRHGREAVAIARLAGFFPDGSSESFSLASAGGGRVAEGSEYSKINGWKEELATALRVQDEEGSASLTDSRTENEKSKRKRKGKAKADVVDMASVKEWRKALVGECGLEGSSPDQLLEQQRRVFDIITQHAKDLKDGKESKPLLLLVLGEGGVGKSKVIQTVTEWFNSNPDAGQLVKSSYTGIASSLIDGKTLHSLCSISTSGEKSRGISNSVKKAQEELWNAKTHLIIDEVSMVSKQMLAAVERRIASARSAGTNNWEDGRAFGGTNVIMFGDFHQFPPVAGTALYARRIPGEPEDVAFGGMIYEQFSSVVVLSEQVRVTDPSWLDILRRSRQGACTREDLHFLRTLVLGAPDCPPTDFSTFPWCDAVLITPRHGVRVRWNEMALEQHALRTGNPIYVCQAQDTIQGRPLSMEERFAVHSKSAAGRGSRGRQDRGGLPFNVEMAVGMKVMVTFNVDQELDLANGARGEIHDIIFAEDEEFDPGEVRRHVSRLPVCVLVKMDRTRAPRLTGLPENVIPLFPKERKFQISVGSSKKTVTRLQFPLTGAYAFTDYRAQGQTVPYVIVDIGKPPTNDISPFGAYVALSRSHGSANVRLLRDFKDSLFTTHPSQQLREEEQRLFKLAQETKEKWNRSLAV